MGDTVMAGAGRDRHDKPAVRLRGAAVERGGRVVVQGVDLDLDEGTWLGMIGANGSGKSSLLRALAGRLPLVADLCEIDGRDAAHDRALRACKFGFAPSIEMLPDGLRARDVFDLAGNGTGWIRDRYRALYDALELEALADCWIGDCSAGMRQRIAIASAFAQGPQYVVLDEPFNWLDPVAVFDLRAALRAMVADGLTLITALHDLGALALACDAGMMLAQGRCVLTMDANDLRVAARDPAGFESRTIDLLRTRHSSAKGPVQ